MAQRQGFNKELAADIIEQALANEKAAFKHIYNEYADACYSLAMRITGCESNAIDVVHESFVTVMEKMSSYQHQGSFGFWLKRIVVNNAINKLRYQQKFSDEELDTESLDTTSVFDRDWLSSMMDLEKLLTQLDDQSRTVLWLHQVEGYNHKEIAEFFNRSESFSKVSLSRALKKLKQSAELEKNSAFN